MGVVEEYMEKLVGGAAKQSHESGAIRERDTEYGRRRITEYPINHIPNPSLCLYAASALLLPYQCGLLHAPI